MFHPDEITVRFKFGDYFRQGTHKVAISLPDLVSQTNNFSTKNRPGCQPSLNGSNPKDLFLAYNVKCNLPESDPNGHEVKVHFDLSQVEDVSTAKNLDVAVSCSCPAFLYWGGQWNSFQRDALEGEPRPLLTAPTERLDLRNGFVICKHIKAVSERILPSVQFNINNILRKRHVEEHKKQYPETTRKDRLEQRQREMQERQQKRRKQRPQEKNVRKQLEEGIRRREQDEVVKRNTPATPEEKKRVPKLPPEEVPGPTGKLPTPIPDLDEPILPPKKEPVSEPLPQEEPVPQKMPKINPQDRANMNRLLREEQERQNRETQQRLRNNPGTRRR